MVGQKCGPALAGPAAPATTALIVSVLLPRLRKRMLGLIEKFFSIRIFGIAKVCDGAQHRPSVYTIFFSLFR